MDRHVAAIRATAPSGTSASIRETVDRAVEGTWKALTWSIAEVIAGALLVRHAMVLLSSAPDALETQQHVAAAVRWCTDPTTYPGHKEVACAHIVDAVLSGSAFKEGGVESGSDDLLAFGVAKVDTQSGKMKL
ncbi:hypothetical protein M427DRAFT_416413 [Gonapodya prolifera JEL478]|uniref:Uncharacterized protein n=1 Tax=Gonapodya prolifera (strain JEL478) TaxID=1344416 RepID=A0A139A637_GONPJ|nr:hypothetical protein M427DRAFT_416413 [Gonapodya prolifera JEL478]|eukprot:KXS11915.1 hypothetical protein M427DRAFT_416413 [Gonapodya prolifera JEL478]